MRILTLTAQDKSKGKGNSKRGKGKPKKEKANEGADYSDEDNNRKRKKEKKCFNCDQRRHFVKDCKKKKVDQKGKGANSESQDKGVAYCTEELFLVTFQVLLR